MTEPSKSAEQYRYRLLLSELRREAERTQQTEVLPEIEALILSVEAGEQDRPEVLAKLRALADRFDRELEAKAQPVRWLSFLRFTGPGLLALVFLAVLIERRRRRQREVSEAALARLDTGSGSDSSTS